MGEGLGKATEGTVGVSCAVEALKTTFGRLELSGGTYLGTAAVRDGAGAGSGGLRGFTVPQEVLGVGGWGIGGGFMGTACRDGCGAGSGGATEGVCKDEPCVVCKDGPCMGPCGGVGTEGTVADVVDTGGDDCSGGGAMAVELAGLSPSPMKPPSMAPPDSSEDIFFSKLLRVLTVEFLAASASLSKRVLARWRRLRQRIEHVLASLLPRRGSLQLRQFLVLAIFVTF